MLSYAVVISCSHTAQQGKIVQKSCMLVLEILGGEAGRAEVESIFSASETADASEVESFEKSSASMAVAEYQSLSLREIVKAQKLLEIQISISVSVELHEEVGVVAGFEALLPQYLYVLAQAYTSISIQIHRLEQFIGAILLVFC